MKNVRSGKLKRERPGMESTAMQTSTVGRKFLK